MERATFRLTIVLAVVTVLATVLPAQQQGEEPWQWLHGLSEEEAAKLVAEIPRQIEKGPFEPSLESLRSYQCPDWFRDAKFGLWVCYGPQSVAAQHGWYGRYLYTQKPIPPHDTGSYDYHVMHYGHPSQFGFKDLIPRLTGDKFDPDYLAGLFKEAGAKYIAALAVHHENFDLWDSKYHRWNAARMGPKRDFIGLWQKAVRKQGLRFGITSHLARSYSWFQTAHGSDTDGPKAGVPYDGNDPRYQDLYHKPYSETPTPSAWHYPVNPPASWKLQFYLRMKDLLDKYEPDLFYYDGNVPFAPDGEPGLSLITHLYNTNAKRHGGRNEAVMNIKDKGNGIFDDQIAVLDLERQQLMHIRELPWQNDTSIGPWFYEHGAKYQPAGNIIHALIDLVSKNGNLLLNVPMRADGSIDDEAVRTLKEIGRWMSVNGEAIYGTRPWKVFGESQVERAKDDNNIYSWSDDRPARGKDMAGMAAPEVRFTVKGSTIYAICAGWPKTEWVIRSLGAKAGLVNGTIREVSLLGSDSRLEWNVAADGLHIKVPGSQSGDHAWALRVSLK